MKIVCEGASHLTDNMKAEIRQVNYFVMCLDAYQIRLTFKKSGGLRRKYRRGRLWDYLGKINRNGGSER